MAAKLFVGSLPFATTSDQLREMFAKVGQVVEANVVTDKMTAVSVLWRWQVTKMPRKQLRLLMEAILKVERFLFQKLVRRPREKYSSKIIRLR